MTQSTKRHLTLIVFFALVGFLALYWPLFHSETHVPGNRVTDYHLSHWSMWWMRHAFTTGADVYMTDYVMFPGVTNLAYTTLGMFWYPLWALLEPLIGTLATMNVIVWLAFTLRGYVFFLFLRRERLPVGLSLLGGVMLQIMPTAFAIVFWNNVCYMGWFWLPLHLLLWGNVVRSASLRQGALWAILLGVAFWASALTDLQFLLFTAFLLVPYGALTLVEARTKHRAEHQASHDSWWLVRLSGGFWSKYQAKHQASPLQHESGRWIAPGRLIALGVLAVAVMVALLWAVGTLQAFLTYDRSNFLAADINAVERIAFPDGFLGRAEIYWLFPSVGLFWTAFTLIALIVSLTPARRRLGDGRRWFWFALILTPLILSLGPNITLFGATISMPYAWLHELLGGTFRYPGRLAPVFIIPAMVFAGLVWKPFWNRPRLRQARPLLVGGLLLLMFIDLRVFQSVPVTPPVTPYEFYETMGQESGDPYDDYVVIEVPVAAGTGVQWIGDFDDTALQFHGLTHGKRMVNGLLSRTNSDYFWVLRTADPVLSWLGGRRWLEPEFVEAELGRRIEDWPIGYIVVHQDRIGREGPTVQEIIGYFNSLDELLCPFAIEGDAVAYRTTWHPDGCPARIPPEIEPGIYVIDIGSEGDERYIGWGWHWPEAIFDTTIRWMGDQRWTEADPRADLYLDLPPGDYELTVAAQAFWESCDLIVRVNGTEIGAEMVPVEVLTSLIFDVPAEVIGDGQHVTVTLAYEDWTVPAEVGQSADERILSLAVDWVQFVRIME